MKADQHNYVIKDLIYVGFIKYLKFNVVNS